ncbi:nucleotide-binding universal stress UspA family protein [Lutibacter oceani]|uniref:Nucleotide-binding universal stress UspA family protein n=1 Tax=Lutibacter oceani TaxID=1853311 RepID=A0A3D9RMD0_9FLAO|nr:universal stress protein [Lutibacter oceani]REE80937.1 nucleotide-binding universal stress UspA family protein [Lutibacter oceani]
MSFIINTALFKFVSIIKGMKNILILTDFSDKSWNSIVYALGLFQNEQCNFHLLNVENRFENELVGAGYNQVELVQVDNKRDSKRKLEKLIQQINTLKIKGNHNFIPIVEENNIVEATRNQIKEKKIDLIVIGANDIPSKGQIFRNSVSEEVITKVKCSVLVVPEKAVFKGINEIAFPTDYTNFYEAKLLHYLTCKSSYNNASIRFLYLCKNKEKLNDEQVWNKETLHDYFTDKQHSFHSEVNKNLEESLEQFIDNKQIDLIVLAAKNLNLLEQILFRPKSEALKYYSKTPFLALHQSNF